MFFQLFPTLTWGRGWNRVKKKHENRGLQEVLQKVVHLRCWQEAESHLDVRHSECSEKAWTAGEWMNSWYAPADITFCKHLDQKMYMRTWRDEKTNFNIQFVRI